MYIPDEYMFKLLTIVELPVIGTNHLHINMVAHGVGYISADRADEDLSLHLYIYFQ